MSWAVGMPVLRMLTRLIFEWRIERVSGGERVELVLVLVSQNIASGFQPGITTSLTHGPTFRS